jgi:hypothetical protein
MRSLMPNQRLKVIPIRPDRPMYNEHEQIADFAYELWLATCFRRSGSPEESLLRAVLETTFQKQKRGIRVGLFLIPKPDS